MKILVYGAGVLGSYLAHTLIKSGNEVTMIARNKRYSQLEKDGLVIRHYFQRKTTKDTVSITKELEANDYYDLIFVVMKYNQFSSVLPILANNISKNIILMGNNADAINMKKFLDDNSSIKKNVAFGFQTSAGMREDTGRVVSIHGGGNVMIGELDNTSIVYALVKEAFNNNYKVNFQRDIDLWLKSHYVYIIPMNAIQYLNNGDSHSISRNKKDLNQMINATDEGFMVLEKLGYSITPAIQGKMVRKYSKLYYIAMKIYHKLPMNKVVKGDFSEIYELYEKFDVLKKAAGIPTPNWDILEKKSLEKYKHEKTIEA